MMGREGGYIETRFQKPILACIGISSTTIGLNNDITT